MLIKIALAGDESFYMNGDYTRLGVSTFAHCLALQQITRKSAANRVKIIVFCKLVLDTFARNRYRSISCDAIPRPK